MRAIREQVPRQLDEAVFCERLTANSYGTPWHFHPELELTLILKSSGHRIVGDNITSLQPGDLVLLGANLPHVYYQERGGGRIEAIVVQFVENFAGNELLTHPSLRPIRLLFQRALRGLQIPKHTRDLVAERMHRIVEANPLRRIVELLGILEELSSSKELSPLCSPAYAPPLETADHNRVSRVMQYIHDHLQEPLSRERTAEAAALSVSAFSRFFKARTGRTFPTYVNELRLGRAARLLTESDERVADIARDCGFPNLSHFNRLFLHYKGIKPLQFRKQVTLGIQPGSASQRHKSII